MEESPVNGLQFLLEVFIFGLGGDIGQKTRPRLRPHCHLSLAHQQSHRHLSQSLLNHRPNVGLDWQDWM
jgi:hypothetical protein